MDLDNLIRSFGHKIRPDPLSGIIDISAVALYIANNPDDPGAIEALRQAKEHSDMRNSLRKGLHNDSLWLIKLHFDGVRDAKLGDLSVLRMLRRNKEHDSDEFEGIPNSEQVEKFIQAAMAIPLANFKPCLPEVLVLSSNLGSHEAALRPFLDSLPTPFQWRVAPVEFEANINEFVYEGEKIRFRQYMKHAKQKKDDGNKVYGAKSSQAAVECYEDAIDFLDKAFVRLRPGDTEMINEANSLQAICFANSSIARLLTGLEEDIKKSIKDAKRAIYRDPSYAKGYVRLSRAYEAQGKVADAEEALVQALPLPELENCKGLVDHLISLQTGGKGLPTDPEGFQKWSEETFSDGQERATRMQGVGGLWLKICNEYIDKMRSLETTQD